METSCLATLEAEEEDPPDNCETRVWEEARLLEVRPVELMVGVGLFVLSALSALASTFSSPSSPLLDWVSFVGDFGTLSS